MIPSRFCNLVEARRRFGDLADLSAEALMQGDPLADATIKSFEGQPREFSIQKIETALANGIESVKDCPDALKDLFRSAESIPDWVNWTHVEAGQAAMIREGEDSGLVLTAASLMADYWSPAFSKPLTLTGSLIGDTARRLLQTSAWWVETHTPGGMRREHEGFRTTLRVRLIHARVRYMLQKSGLWQNESWGIPINQSDLLFQIAGFTYLAIRSFQKIGYTFTNSEMSGIYSLWRYISHIFGINPAYIKLVNDDDMRAFYDLWFLTNPPPDEGCRILAHATLYEAAGTSPLQKIMSHLLYVPMLNIYARNFLGDEICDRLHIGGKKTKWILPLLIKPFVSLKEKKIHGDPDKYNEQVEKGTALNRRMISSAGLPLRGRVVAAPTQLSPMGRLKDSVERLP